MDEAHKHLNISEQEWDRFMEIFNEVCGEFGLAAEDVDDLNALMISMMDECVVFPGERGYLVKVAAPAYATVLRPAPYEAVGWETRWKEVDDAMSISTRL